MYKNDELLEMAQKLHEDFEEYREKDFTGKDICRKRGIDLYFNNYFQSLALISFRSSTLQRRSNN